jgi:hypothetical protein
MPSARPTGWARNGPSPRTAGAGGLWTKVKEFLWGVFVFGWYQELQRERAKAMDALHLLVFGETIGIPLMNSPLALRLLPYLYPGIEGWKRRAAADPEVLEEAPHVH